ncbi:hypothetical protein D9M70_638970 [compost metagenome]
MLAATFIATFFIPMFYSLIARKPPKKRPDDVAATPAPAQTAPDEGNGPAH